jgi:hypothetical protein
MGNEQGGSSWWKWCLGGCLIMFLMCGGGFGFVGYKIKKGLSTDQVQVETVAKSMVTCEIPEGYKGVLSMDFLGFMQMVQIGPESMNLAEADPQAAKPQDMPLIISLMTFSKDLDAQTRQQLQQSQGSNGQNQQQLTVESSQEIELEVGDEDRIFQEVIGTQQDGSRIKQVNGTLPGVDGQVVIVSFMGSEETFDEDAMKAFLKSIKK